MREHAQEFFTAAGCIIEEIVVRPLFADGLEQAVWKAAEFAMAHQVGVTVRLEKREFRIIPRELIRSIFDVEREE